MSKDYSNETSQNWLNSCFMRLKVPPLAQSYRTISPWFDSPLGKEMLNVETQMLRGVLSNLFGYHFMQLSVCESADFSSLSRINHSFKMSPTADESIDSRYSAVSEFGQLPFANEQIDVTLLHHVLEFSDNPHQVLKEAARVTMPRGYIVIVGFNPASITGVIHRSCKLFKKTGISKRHYLNGRRMRDWLEFLDFSCVHKQFGGFNLPINRRAYLKHSRFIDRMIGGSILPMGMCYCLVARKDKVGMTPIKPKWNRSSLIEAVPVPKQAIKVQNARSALVLPFRQKNK